jgi:hypothetical protein
MKRDTTSLLHRTIWGVTLSWALGCGGVPETPETGEELATSDVSEALADECSGALGTGTYKGYFCPSHNFITTQAISCAEARNNCVLNANSNPGSSVFCTWNNRVIYRRDVSAGACNSLVCSAVTGTGQYKGYVCPSHNFISTNAISCQEAQSNCQLNANSNPSSSFYCTWNGTEIFRLERTAGICPR